MKNILSVLIILIVGLTFSCSHDNVYEKDNRGFVVTLKERIAESDMTLAKSWKYKYEVQDFSNTAGNSAGLEFGSFNLYTSNQFSVDDTLTFTTKQAIRDALKMADRLSYLEEMYSEYTLIKANNDSLQILVVDQSQAVSDANTLIKSLGVKLTAATEVNSKNIELQSKLTDARAKIQKLNKFKDSMKKLIE